MADGEEMESNLVSLFLVLAHREENQQTKFDRKRRDEPAWSCE